MQINSLFSACNFLIPTGRFFRIEQWLFSVKFFQVTTIDDLLGTGQSESEEQDWSMEESRKNGMQRSLSP
jgi:hypothetical protein